MLNILYGDKIIIYIFSIILALALGAYLCYTRINYKKPTTKKTTKSNTNKNVKKNSTKKPATKKSTKK